MHPVYLAYSLGFAALFLFAAFLVNDYCGVRKMLRKVLATENEKET
ncbi:MAG: hypothetical protein AB8U69_03805 [Anaplasma ovis]